MGPPGTVPNPGVRHPPRPQLTLRVGITGHRWNRLDRRREPRLLEQIGSVLSQLAGIADRIRDDPECGYRAAYPLPGDPVPPRPSLRLVSPLAEGADRLLPQGAPAGWKLQAILPFEQSVYEQDFQENGSVDEFRTLLARAKREEGVTVLYGDRLAHNAFEPVGTAICLNSDVMLTIWDGLPSQGPGGTATIVELAKHLGLPVIRIAPDGATDPWLHLPEEDDGGRRFALSGLEERLRRLFAPPSALGHSGREANPSPTDEEEEEDEEEDLKVDLREEYFQERWRRGRRGQSYGLVVRLLTPTLRELGKWWKDLRRALGQLTKSHPADYGDAIRQRWRARWKELGLSDQLATSLLNTTLPDHYGWASYLANYYAGRYRSSSLLAYALSWLAALAAAVGFSLGIASGFEPSQVLPAAGAELVILVAILFIVFRARQGKFHERWLAYRQLTEALRPLLYTLPVARAAIRPLGHFPDSETWVDWIHRAIVREIGMPPAAMTPAHIEEVRTLLVEGELTEQIEYHRKTATMQSRLGHRLHILTDVIFYGALGLAIYHFKKELLHLHQESTGTPPEPSFARPELKVLLVGTIGITLPVLASAAHGFIAQGEFEETAHRARATRRELKRLKNLAQSRTHPWTCDSLGEFAADVALAMGQEVGAWFATYRVKGVPLP